MMNLAKSHPQPLPPFPLTQPASLLDYLPKQTLLDDIIDDVLPLPLPRHMNELPSEPQAMNGLSSVAFPKPTATVSDEEGLMIDVNYSLAPKYTPHPKQWRLTKKEKEDISVSISQTWTDQAIRCFMTASNCATCDIPNGCYSFACQMNKVVPVLLESLGKPDIRRVKRIYPQGFNMIDADAAMLDDDDYSELMLTQSDD
ncbi:MAG: hypothetical protein ACKO34_03140 [Vampirovibrionales bacterium]